MDSMWGFDPTQPKGEVMLILPMVGVLHRALTAIKSFLHLGKKRGKGRKGKLLAKRLQENLAQKGIAKKRAGTKAREILQIVVARKLKKLVAAQNKQPTANLPPKRGRKAKPVAKNPANAAPKGSANAAPNAKAPKVARLVRRRTRNV
jgi:hypothetical protein